VLIVTIAEAFAGGVAAGAFVLVEEAAPAEVEEGTVCPKPGMADAKSNPQATRDVSR
jgi:hypothetical protein